VASLFFVFTFFLLSSPFSFSFFFLGFFFFGFVVFGIEQGEREVKGGLVDGLVALAGLGEDDEVGDAEHQAHGADGEAGNEDDLQGVEVDTELLVPLPLKLRGDEDLLGNENSRVHHSECHVRVEATVGDVVRGVEHEVDLKPLVRAQSISGDWLNVNNGGAVLEIRHGVQVYKGFEKW